MPLNPDLIDDFDPEEVPTVGRLLRELNESADDMDEGSVKRSEGECNFNLAHQQTTIVHHSSRILSCLKSTSQRS